MVVRGERAVGPEAGGVIARLIQEFGKLPGIGPKTAERLTHHLLNADRRQSLALAEALQAVAERVRPCRQCFNLTEGELCSICSDPRRDAALICVVEQPRDLAIGDVDGDGRADIVLIIHDRVLVYRQDPGPSPSKPGQSGTKPVAARTGR